MQAEFIVLIITKSSENPYLDKTTDSLNSHTIYLTSRLNSVMMHSQMIMVTAYRRLKVVTIW